VFGVMYIEELYYIQPLVMSLDAYVQNKLAHNFRVNFHVNFHVKYCTHLEIDELTNI